MAKVGYEKPEMQKVSLINESSVADTCWGYHGSSTRLYCDLEGEGWASFQIEAGSCKLNLMNVKYHEDEDDLGTTIRDGHEKYDLLEYTLRNAGGNQGNPYKDKTVTIVPDAPKPEWS